MVGYLIVFLSLLEQVQLVLKNKIVHLLKTNTPKQTVYERGKKLSKPRNQILKSPYIRRKQKKIKGGIVRDIQILFETEKEEKKK